MTTQQNNDITPTWIEGDLRLAGALDNRVIGLLKAIEQTGSLNQAAKQVGLSYKGAWQIIERTNNSSPKILVSTATGGAKGGGTSLTEAGQALVALFIDLEKQHHAFLKQLNHSLTTDSDTLLLLQRLIVKTSARNQLFGRILDIHTGAVNSEVIVKLKRGELINVTVSLSFLNETGLMVGSDAILLINSTDITLVISDSINQFSACNRLPCRVINIQENKVNAEIMVLLEGGETLTVTNSQEGMQNLELKVGMTLWVIFKSNAPMLGVKS